MSEKEELIQLKLDSQKSFENLYIRYSAKLYNFVLKLSNGDMYMAEELVQRTFIKVWENRSKIEPEKGFINYVCTIARNMLLNEYQHKTIEFIYKDFIKENYSTTIDNIELEVSKNLLDEYIEKLTNKLPEKRREIFILSRRKGLSNKEIAKKLNISESTIETQLSKALAFLKKELSMHYELIIIAIINIYIK